MDEYKVNLNNLVTDITIQNLLLLQEKCCQEGKVKEAIQTTKFLLKLTKKVGDEVLEIGTQKCKCTCNEPPYKSENDIQYSE